MTTRPQTSSTQMMTMIEHFWNQEMDSPDWMAANMPILPDRKALARAMTEPDNTPARQKLLASLAEFSDLMELTETAEPASKSEPVPVRKTDRATQDLLMQMTRQAFSGVGLGRFALAMLEGMLEDHPKLILSLIQQPDEPHKIQFKTLLKKLDALSQESEATYERELEALNQKWVVPVQKENNPMLSIQRAQQAQMAAMDTVMSNLQSRLESTNPLA